MFQKFQKSLFAKRLQAAGIYTQVTASQQIEEAQRLLIELFGDGVQQFAKPVYVKNRALTIEVYHPAICEELRRREEAILSELNEKFGRSELVRIQFVLPKTEQPQ